MLSKPNNFKPDFSDKDVRKIFFLLSVSTQRLLTGIIWGRWDREPMRRSFDPAWRRLPGRSGVFRGMSYGEMWSRFDTGLASSDDDPTGPRNTGNQVTEALDELKEESRCVWDSPWLCSPGRQMLNIIFRGKKKTNPQNNLWLCWTS